MRICRVEGKVQANGTDEIILQRQGVHVTGRMDFFGTITRLSSYSSWAGTKDAEERFDKDVWKYGRPNESG